MFANPHRRHRAIPRPGQKKRPCQIRKQERRDTKHTRVTLKHVSYATDRRVRERVGTVSIALLSKDFVNIEVKSSICKH